MESFELAVPEEEEEEEERHSQPSGYPGTAGSPSIPNTVERYISALLSALLSLGTVVAAVGSGAEALLDADLLP
jgi:hypothetical protein